MDFPQEFYCATYEKTSFAKHIAAPMFINKFSINDVDGFNNAQLLISALGFYDLFINRKRITKGFLAPYISNPDDLVYYDFYDIKDSLKNGMNTILIVLGNGFQNNIDTVWDFDSAKHNASPRFALNIIIDSEKILTAKDFKTMDSPITFDNYRCGTHYDARKEIENIFDDNYDISNWNDILPAETPRGSARLCQAEPIKIIREIKAIDYYQGRMRPHFAREDVVKDLKNIDIIPVPTDEENGYIYDFGVNTAGVFKLKIDAEPGQRIVIDFAERLNDKGEFDSTNISFFYPDGYGQRDVYICKGGGVEEYIPQFTYHGGRYMYISGIKESQAKEDLLTYLEMSSDLQVRSDFISSDETINTLWEMAKRSDLSNFYYFPTDCPHREKNGWTGDASISTEHLLINYKSEISLAQWLDNICLAQREDGALPGIVPTTGWGFVGFNGPAWDSVIVEIPYKIYQYTGNIEPFKNAAPNILRYLNYISGRRDRRGIIEFGLGDWCPVGRGPDEYLVPLGITDSILTFDMCKKAEVLYKKINNILAASFAKTLGEELRQAIRDTYLDLDSLYLEGKTQTGQSMGIYYGIYNEEEIAQAYDNLINLIDSNAGSMDVGFLGGRVIFHVLSQYGNSDLAFNMIAKKEYPSYGYLITRGATSLWEMILPEPRLSGSENHHFWGDISHWYVRQLLGMNINPNLENPNKIVLKPRFVSSLNWVEGSYEAELGVIKVSWRRVNDDIIFELDIDNGLEVDLYLDSGFIIKQSRQNSVKDIKSGSYKIITQ